MDRRGSRLLAVLACAAALAACAGEGSPASPGPVPGSSATSTTSRPAAGPAPSTGPAPTQHPPGTPTGAGPTSRDAAPEGSLAGRVVLLDPGHNGGNAAHPEVIDRPVDAGGFTKACNTTGTAAGGVTESSVNLRMAQLLAERLRARGATVVLTREDDTGVGPCIDERANLAARLGADVLVSIHADGAPAGQHGFHVISPGHRPGFTDGIVEPSRELAVAVRDGLVGQGLAVSTYAGSAGLVDRTDLGTLNLAGVPAVMVELGNMHNDEDFGRLTTPSGQSIHADGLAAGIIAHLS